MKNVGWKIVLLLIIPYVFIVGFFQLIGYIIADVPIENATIVETPIQRLIISFFDLLGTFILLWIFMKYVDQEKLINLGFCLKNRLKEFVFGIAIGAFIITTGFVALLSFNQISFIELQLNPSELIISVLLFSIVAIVEEVLLRGYVLRNFMYSFNKYVA